MYVLVTYDVATSSADGRKRLRHVAKACLDYGQRVQNSVFEMKVDPAQWTDCRNRLEEIINPSEDSLRFYFLGANWKRRVEHVGTKPGYDVDGPLIV
ncbi:CRISPR-associated endoribonuclease Cas2 [Thalassoglobus neptunius]|uniref:CRISPR-associated endoribonuclease Cas2 n=1 Tax=Thalassoglobus neptunius TaxID=1938619 RepID=A0A5C5W986_9PLAN|nr:CRISPR-associated endonuclease Cas2 [Thalassoglobus neptunius]TWT47057.1 CRISPR-associated endoribonuclease Cas2 [Thalassoglobus neptunius]